MFHYKFEYILDPDVPIIDIKPPKGIEFEFSDEDALRTIRGFSISFEETNDIDAQIRADKIAQIMTDGILLSTGRYTESIFSSSINLDSKIGKVSMRISGETIALIPALANLDWTDMTMESIVQQVYDPGFETRLQSLRLGLKAWREGRYEGAFLQFYLVVEGNLGKDSEKYSILRDALSHKRLVQKTAKKAIEKLDLDLMGGVLYDRSSIKNGKILERATSEIRAIATEFLLNHYVKIPVSKRH